MSSSILQVSLANAGQGSDSTAELRAPELERKISDLAQSLSGFKSALSEFKNATKNQSQDAKFQQQRFVEEQRTSRTSMQKDKAAITAGVQTDPRVIAQRQAQAESARYQNLASLQRNQNAGGLLELGRQQLSGGDAKWGRELINKVADSTARGTTKALTDKTFWHNVIGAGSMAAIAGVTSKYFQGQTGMGSGALANPMSNGYDYGAQVSSFNTLSAARNYGGLSLGLTALGALGGALGMAAGASAGSIVSSLGMSDATLQSQVQHDVVNNKMNIEALRATNAPASGVVNSAMNGRKLSDVQVPMIQTIAKGISVYNKNFEAVTKLTKSVLDFSQAAQLDIGTTSQVASGVGYLSRVKGFDFENTKSLFKAYGTTDYAGALSGAVGFAQAGFSPQKAQEMALQYQSMNPGMQSAASNVYSSASNRFASGLQFKALTGVDLQDYLDPSSKGHAKAYSVISGMANAARANPNSAASMVTDTKLQAIGGAYSVPLSDFQLAGGSRNAVGMTATQTKMISSINQDRQLALNNGLDASAAGKQLSDLATGATAATVSTNSLTRHFQDLSNVLSNFTKIITGHSNTGMNSNGAGSSQSKNH